MHKIGSDKKTLDTSKPSLSVLCVFRNRKEWIEPTLQALYEIQRIPCEIIIINDGSTDNSAETIRSLISHYDHEQTLYYENEVPRGRGNSLNMALEQVSGQILWIPENLQSVDEALLMDAVNALLSSDAQFVMGMQENPPDSALEWLQLLQNERLPFDRDYLFNLHSIRPGKVFTDPHWSTRHASEWAIRFQSEAGPVRVTPFSSGDSSQLRMDDRSKKECVFALLRTPNLTLSGQEKAFRMLRSYGHTDLEEVLGSVEELFQEAQFLFKTGNSVAALELLNRVLATSPEHRRSRSLKIEILEKMRRFVEASQVKHEGSIFQDQPDDRIFEPEPGKPVESAGTDHSNFDMDPSTESGESDKMGSESEASMDSGETVPSDFESGTPDGSGEITKSDTGPPAEKDTGYASKPGEPVESDQSYPFTEPESTISTSAFEEELRNQLPLSIIIPTSTNKRPVLEKCLASVFRYTSSENTRLIIIDNGSVDDTAEYLDELLKSNTSITVLANEQNLGFAAAVNQGLAKAGDGPVLVMHNDVIFQNPVPARMSHALTKNPDIGLIAPKADKTWNPLQRTGNSGGLNPEISDPHHETAIQDNDSYTDVDYIDGYCMAFRNESGLTMSKDYGLAFFDDADFCLRIQKKGFRVVVADREEVRHLSGLTTGDLGLTLYSKFYWKNSALFHKKWSMEPHFPANKTSIDPIHQFVIIGQLINPFYPEKHLLEYFEELFTSEQKTRVFHSEFPPDALKSMIRLMMAANQREMLRRLEQQLDDLPPDIPLYRDLIAFYFERTIYSRCKLYLDKIEPSELPLDFALFRIKVAIGEKDYQNAAFLLKELMDRIPTHPEVLLAAAEIHRRNGNREQSEKFTALARSFNPYISV